jgi:SulP family sulfate permease
MKHPFAYSWPKGRQDLTAGLTVAAISLPQAMAYALIAGVDPRYGLYSAIVVTAVASIFGSSSHLINGPTNAISLVVFSALAFLDPDSRGEVAQALFLLGISVGVIQILIAVLRLGDLTRYISESVIIGFMAGASVLIMVSQIGNLLGLHNQGSGHLSVLHRLYLTLTGGGAVNAHAVMIGAGTIVLVLLLRRGARALGLPPLEMLTALIIATACSSWLGWTSSSGSGAPAIDVVGRVPASLPAFHIPVISLQWFEHLGGSALAIAALGLVEAIAIAKSIAFTTRQRLDFNRQCLAEGLANLTGGFFQSLPGSGSLTRSAINFQAGAATRFSGIIAAIAVSAVLVLAAPLAHDIPKSALAGLLMVMAVRLIDGKRLLYALRARWYDAALVITTAIVAIVYDVEYAILIGVALSLALFVNRAAKVHVRELIVASPGVVRERVGEDRSASDLLIFDLEGELFFGASPEFDHCLDAILDRAIAEGQRVVILRVRRTRHPDAVFFERLEHFLTSAAAHGITILMAGVRADFAKGLEHLHFHTWFPKDQVFHEEERTFSATLKAVHHAHRLLGRPDPVSVSIAGTTTSLETNLTYSV